MKAFTTDEQEVVKNLLAAQKVFRTLPKYEDNELKDAEFHFNSLQRILMARLTVRDHPTIFKQPEGKLELLTGILPNGMECLIEIMWPLGTVSRNFILKANTKTKYKAYLKQLAKEGKPIAIKIMGAKYDGVTLLDCYLGLRRVNGDIIVTFHAIG